jgi:formamidopyrimidine-DNA glycosylase
VSAPGCYPDEVPELPEVEAVRLALDPVLTGARIERVELRRAGLRAPFPSRFQPDIEGQRVARLTRRAKYLMATLSSGDVLVMHLGMSGSFRTEPAEHGGGDDSDPHDHVLFHLDSGTTVIFNDPRRFGVMDLLSPAALAAHASIGGLGPEPLSPAFDAAALARACRGKKVSLKAALLDQRVVAGVGNIYACEALHVARLSPARKASTLATPAGRPRESAERLARAIKAVLSRAIARAGRADYRSDRFHVYDREGRPCPRRGCGGTIKRQVQGGRSTFHCPRCQR